jgi:hypothetical protein
MQSARLPKALAGLPCIRLDNDLRASAHESQVVGVQAALMLLDQSLLMGAKTHQVQRFIMMQTLRRRQMRSHLSRDVHASWFRSRVC